MEIQRFERIPCLDGLRCISIVLVLIQHAKIADFEHSFFNDGNLGVRIFFVISGYIISKILIFEYKETSRIELKPFFARRFAKLLPTLYLYCALLFVLTAAFGGVSDFHSFLRAATFTVGHVSTISNNALHHTWSLSIEEAFYLLWAPLLAFALRSRRVTISYVIYLLLFIGPVVRGVNAMCSSLRWQPLLPESLHGLFIPVLDYADIIAIGAGAAFWGLNFARFQPGLLRLISRGSVLILLGISMFRTPGQNSIANAFFTVFSTPIQAVAVMTLILSVNQLRSGIIYKVLNSRLFVQVGLCSYSIYIWQQLFFYSSEQFSLDLPASVSLLAAVSVGILMYYLVENPGNKFLRKLWIKKSSAIDGTGYPNENRALIRKL